jgi:menaquinone-9 beta-reductase
MGVVRPVSRLEKIALVAHYAGLPEDAPGSVEMYVAGGDGAVSDGSPAVCGFGTGPGDTANVTLVVSESESRRVAGLGAEGYADATLVSRFPAVAERLAGARRERIRTRGTHGHTTTTPVADGALLVGDAACFIDPFTGEGVYFALRGAELVAEHAGEALRRGDTSARGLAAYARARRRELVPKYRVCDLVERAVHQPGLLRWAGPKLERNPRLLERILAVTGDMAPPASLLSPRLLWEFASA